MIRTLKKLVLHQHIYIDDEVLMIAVFHHDYLPMQLRPTCKGVEKNEEVTQLYESLKLDHSGRSTSLGRVFCPHNLSAGFGNFICRYWWPCVVWVTWVDLDQMWSQD